MSYDEGLAERIREQLQDRTDIEERKMFGGLSFMMSGHMCCGIVKDTLMVRVGLENYENCLSRKYASEMDFTGKIMKGMVYVSPEGLEKDENIADWLCLCLSFVDSLPEKPQK